MLNELVNVPESNLPQHQWDFDRTREVTPSQERIRTTSKDPEPVLEAGEEVYIKLGATRWGHGRDRRKSWRLPGRSRRVGNMQYSNNPQTMRRRIESKPVMGFSSGRHCFVIILGASSHSQADGTRRILA